MSFSFSHQFHRHWLAAPKTIREEIKQELKDIIALLEPKAGSSVVAKKQQELDLYSPTGVTQRAEQDNQHHLPEAILAESADLAVANLAKTAAEGANKPQLTPVATHQSPLLPDSTPPQNNKPTHAAAVSPAVPSKQPTTANVASNNNASITRSPAYLTPTKTKNLSDETEWLNDANRYIDEKVAELKAELNQWLTQQLKQRP